MRVLVVYDIAIYESGTKRLTRTEKLCEKYCTRVQDSVFEGRLDESELVKLMNDIKKSINIKYDSVRIYRLANDTSTNNPIIIGQKVITEKLSDDAFIL